MKKRLWRSLTLVSALLAVFMVAIYGTFFNWQLKQWLMNRAQTELLRYTRTVKFQLEKLTFQEYLSQCNALALSFGNTTMARVTLINETGTVIADSDLSPQQIAKLDNHLQRPEIQMIASSQSKSITRYSETLGMPMLYLALPLQWEQQRKGFVRLSLPIHQLEEPLIFIRWMLVAAAAIVLIGILIFSAITSRSLSRTLQRLLRKAKTLAHGDGWESSFRQVPEDEIGGLIAEFEHLMSTLVEERDRFEAVLQSMAEALILLDKYGCILLLNPAARELLELPPMCVGRNLLEIIGSHDLETLVNDALQGKSGTAEVQLSGPSRRQALAQCTPQRSGPGIVLVMHDITELRSLERVRRDFIANASHELRTPVSVIRANAETLLDGALEQPEQAKTFVKALLRNAERLSHLVSDLLDISRIESGRFHLEPRIIDLNPIVDHTIEAVVRTAQHAGLTLTIEVESGLKIYADSDALEQSILNLLDNAIKYTPAGGAIIVKAVQDSNSIHIEIIDNGPGIAPKHRQRIFERFYRVDKGRSRAMGNTGLGLSIVKNLVESMNGRVGMKPNEPHGSIFWITLPAQAPQTETSDD